MRESDVCDDHFREETFVTALLHLVGIVDDDQSVRRALRRLFKSAGYQAEAYFAWEKLEGPMCSIGYPESPYEKRGP